MTTTTGTPIEQSEIESRNGGGRQRAQRVAGRRASRTEGGRRMLDALVAVDTFPALADAHTQLRAVLNRAPLAPNKIVAIVERDPALAIAVMRRANSARPERERCDSVPRAVSRLDRDALAGVTETVQTFDFLEGSSPWGELAVRFRFHALLTQQAVDAIAVELAHRERDRLALAALLHDVGKLAMVQLHPGFMAGLAHEDAGPTESVMRERRELGVDHALIGGVLARRWGLPREIAESIERHHGAEGSREAGVIRLADMLAHHWQGARVRATQMLAAAAALGIDRDALRKIICEQGACSRPRPISSEPCPLTHKELMVVQRLGQGQVYKQIACSLGISSSVVRTHLSNAYAKLGVADRAQAVLLAHDRGWL